MHSPLCAYVVLMRRGQCVFIAPQQRDDSDPHCHLREVADFLGNIMLAQRNAAVSRLLWRPGRVRERSEQRKNPPSPKPGRTVAREAGVLLDPVTGEFVSDFSV
jgi:hypothetical protein